MILMGYFMIYNQLVISIHWWVISPSKVTKTWQTWPHDATRRDPWKFCWTWRFHGEKWWNMVDKNGRKWWKMVKNGEQLWKMKIEHIKTWGNRGFHHISPYFTIFHPENDWFLVANEDFTTQWGKHQVWLNCWLSEEILWAGVVWALVLSWASRTIPAHVCPKNRVMYIFHGSKMF